MNKQSEIMSRVEEHFQEVLPHFLRIKLWEYSCREVKTMIWT